MKMRQFDVGYKVDKEGKGEPICQQDTQTQ